MGANTKENYFFEDFTEKNYKKILLNAKKKYQFIMFDYNEINSSNHGILWRHDVDFSLNRALALAIMEKELGVRATYFLHLHSYGYHIFEPKQTDIVNEIIKLGHDIGLHFDHGYAEQNLRMQDEKSKIALAVKEKEILEFHFPSTKIRAVSFHNPEASNVLNLEQDYYAGMVNAYAKTIKDKFTYCSDSNGYWRFKRLENLLEESNNENLQILTHPVWWTPNILAPSDRMKRCFFGRATGNYEEYCNDLTIFKRKNIT